MTIDVLLIIFGTLIISLILGLFMIPQILRYSKKNNHYDRIDGRKLHVTNIPRLGGMAFLPSMLLSFLIAIALYNYTADEIKISMWSVGVLVGMVIVYVTGLVDDYEELSPRVKFIAQFFAALLMPACGLYLNDLYGLFGVHELSPWVGVPLTVFLVMFVNNSINLIDGIDGLCASISILIFTGFLIMFISEGVVVYSALVAGIIGVLIAYFYFNVFGSAEKETKIFMGDSGSLLLGYMLSFLSLKFAVHNTLVMPYHDYALMFPLTLLLIPTFDVVRVILVRWQHGVSPSSPDKRHVHHKLLAAGLNQHQALCVIIVAQLCFIGLNYALYISDVNCNLILLVDVIIFVAGHTLLNFLRKEGME